MPSSNHNNRTRSRSKRQSGKNRLRVFAPRNTTTGNSNHSHTTSIQPSTTFPSDRTNMSASDRTHATLSPSRDSNAHPPARQVRQLGCNKDCCGGFCLRLGRTTCCAHAPRDDDDHQSTTTSVSTATEQRYCSFCCDRRREERRVLRQMEQRRLQLVLLGNNNTVAEDMISTSGSSTAGGNEMTSISKACCGNPCMGPSYTHCCEHNGGRSVLNYETYCHLCRERCLQSDDNSVDAVRLTPTPPGRHLGEDRGIKNNKEIQIITDQLEQLNDQSLERCVHKCLSSIECPVCLEPYGADPCTLPCGHSICLTHISSVDKCPICRCPLHKEWKAKYAQPSIALRESAMAVREAVTLMIRMESRKQQQSPTSIKTVKSKSRTTRPIQWSPPEAPIRCPPVERVVSDSTTYTSSSSDAEPVPRSPSSTRSTTKVVVIGKSVDC